MIEPQSSQAVKSEVCNGERTKARLWGSLETNFPEAFRDRLRFVDFRRWVKHSRAPGLDFARHS
jgi:hypothetical protein